MSIQGEKGSNDEAAANAFAKSLTAHIVQCKYTPKEAISILISFDEFGLQFKSLPKRTYAHKQTPVKAKKHVKARISVLVGAAMDGHRFKPLVIGKYKRPRCFKGVNMSTLPVHYYHNRSAWMNQEIFTDWFLYHFLPEVREHYGS